MTKSNDLQLNKSFRCKFSNCPSWFSEWNYFWMINKNKKNTHSLETFKSKSDYTGHAISLFYATSKRQSRSRS